MSLIFAYNSIKRFSSLYIKYLFIQHGEVPIDNRLHFRAIKAIAYSNPILIPFSWRDQVVVRCNSVLKEKNTE